jgi:hypothetical protein
MNVWGWVMHVLHVMLLFCLGMGGMNGWGWVFHVMPYFCLGMGGMNGFQRTTSTKSLHLLGSHQADWSGQGAGGMAGVWPAGTAALGYPLPAQGQFPPLVPGNIELTIT